MEESIELELREAEGSYPWGKPAGEGAFDTPLSVLVTAEQKLFVERAAGRRQCSGGAIVRAALESYRRLHPTLDAPE